VYPSLFACVHVCVQAYACMHVCMCMWYVGVCTCMYACMRRAHVNVHMYMRAVACTVRRSMIMLISRKRK
jgi:hypothetical protein